MASSMTHEERHEAVQNQLLIQLWQLVNSMQEARVTNGAAANNQFEASQGVSCSDVNSKNGTMKVKRGLAAAVGASSKPQTEPKVIIREPDTIRKEVSFSTEKLKKKLGFSLAVRPSLQDSGNAGNGLWLDGAVQLGSVVALYPGLVYSPLAYRKIPGYPRVDQDNNYLITRFDGGVLDAKPWMTHQAPATQGSSSTDPSSATLSGKGSPSASWKQQLEMCNPIALAHYANHPSEGAEPNVMVAAFDITYQAGCSLRAYIPNVEVDPDDNYLKPNMTADQGGTVPGLAIVACRPMQDEELLLNYRLSTYMSRPSWYKAVDEEEERRRWA